VNAPRKSIYDRFNDYRHKIKDLDRLRPTGNASE
jgi:hypothetical protein